MVFGGSTSQDSPTTTRLVFVCFYIISLLSFQDWADGEFSRMKDMLALHLHRHSMEDEGYFEVQDSATFCQYAKKNMETPGPKSGIERRTFYDMKDETIKARSAEVNTKNVHKLLTNLT